MKNINKLTFVLVILSIFISCISLILILETKNKTLGYSITNISNKDYNCTNLNIVNASRCLLNELSKWYNYNNSNLNKDLTEEQLKTEGSVCWGYSDWYDAKAKELGFYSQKIIMDLNDTIRHQITLISNEDAFCILDQTTVSCFPFRSKNE